MTEDGGKKSRWRGMLGKKDKDDTGGTLAKETEKSQVNDDVMDFLAPSIAKANSVSTRASPMKMPKIDVAAAQRFPGTNNIGNGSPGRRSSAGPQSSILSDGFRTKKRSRRPNLKVSFANTPPDVIGEGGDEAELPVMAIGKIREHKPPDWDRVRHGSRDDSVLHHNRLHGSRDDSAVSPPDQFNGQPYAQSQFPLAQGLRRAMTHGHEHVSPMQKSVQLYGVPAPRAPLQRPHDPFADDPDDFQPKPLSRTATGWSDYTPEHDAADDFRPKSLSRTATGWSDVQEQHDEQIPSQSSGPVHGFSAVGRMDASAEYGIGRPSFSSDGQSSAHPTLEESPERFRQYSQVPDGAPTLPEIELVASESPTEFMKVSTDANHWLAASPTDPNSFSAKLIHKMRAEEGRALHDYVRNSMVINDSDNMPDFSNIDTAQNGVRPQPMQAPDNVAPQSQPPVLQQPRPPIPTSFSYAAPSSRPPLPPQTSYPLPPQPQQDLLVANPRQQATGGSPMPPAHMSLTPREQSPASHHSASTRPTPSPMAPPPAGPSNYFPQEPYQQPPQPPISQQYTAYQAPVEQSPFQQSQSPPLQTSTSQKQYYPPPQPPSQLPYQPPTKATGPASLRGGLPRSLATRMSEAVAPLPSPLQSQGSIRSRDSEVSFTTPTQSVVSNQSSGSTFSTAGPAGEAALEDFAERVQHMSGIFRLTAEVMQPASRYTAKQWLRCCLWWFLRGRAGLEALIQSRQRSRKGSPVYQQGRPVSMHDGSERLCQAHVDLAKVVWMIREIFPTLPAVQPYLRGETVALVAPATAAAAREAGDVEAMQVMEALEAISIAMRLLLASCAKNGGMPPHSSLIQGQDQSIWVPGQVLPRDAAQFVSANPLNSPLDYMPVADTRKDFAFGRMFVNTTISTPTERLEAGPCILSIMRERNTWGLKVAVCSPTDSLTLIIQDEHERHKDQGWGPGWRDVQWDPQRSRMVVDLMGTPATPASVPTPQTPFGRFSALIEFTESDYLQLMNIWNYTRSVSTGMLAARDEKYVHEALAVALQYSEETHMNSSQHRQQSMFPTERVKRCRVRVFEKFQIVESDTGRRRLHRGFRLLAVTSPKVKSLSAVSMDIGSKRPVVCEMTNDDATGQSLPAVTFRNAEETSQTSLYVVFNDSTDRQALLNLITGVTQSKIEHMACVVRLTSLLMEEASIAESFTHNHTNPLRNMRWQDAMLIVEDEEQIQTPEDAVMTENMRIVARGQGIGFTERFNHAPGELKIRLPATGAASTPSATVTILRPHIPAPATTITAISSHPDPSVGGPLTKLLEMSTRQMTAQKYHFPSLAELHKFESALTGHDVMFDGLASAFTISHRIALVPIHKRHGASDVRIQILRRQGDPTALLLAFFEGFALAEATCFKLLSTDVFEVVEGDKKAKKDGEKEAGSWRYGVRLVDAKFSMPKLRRESETQDNESGGDLASRWRRHKRDKSKDSADGGRGSRAGEREAPPVAPDKVAERFVAVDMLEYASEHDDIVIGFDEESDRNAFAEALPAQVNVSRSITFKRRI